MEPVKYIRAEGLYAEAPYAYAATADSGALIFAAGACPLDEHGATIAPGDLEAQTAQAVRNLFAALKASGSGPQYVLKTTVFVVAAERSDLVRAWNVVKSAFAQYDPPSTLLGVSLLGYPDQLVEIEAVAVTPASTQG